MVRCKNGIGSIEFTNPDDQAKFNHFVRQTGDLDLALDLFLNNTDYTLISPDTRSKLRGWTPKIELVEKGALPDFSIESQANLEKFLNEHTIPGFTYEQETDIVSSLTYMLYSMFDGDFSSLKPSTTFKRLNVAIKSEIAKQEKLGHTFVANELVKVLNNWDKFTDAIASNLSSLGYRIKADRVEESRLDFLSEEGEELLQGEDSNYERAKFSDSHFQRDSREGASSRMKLFLKVIPDVEPELGANGKPQLRTSYIGAPKFVKFDVIWNRLKALLSGKSPDFKEYMRILRDESHPVYTMVANRLANASEQIQNEFVQLMSQEHIVPQFLFMEKKIVDGKLLGFSFSPSYSDRNSKVDVVIGAWLENQINSDLTYEEDGNVHIDRNYVREIKDFYLDLYNSYKDTDLKGEAFIDGLEHTLSSLGIVVPRHILNNFEDFVTSELSPTTLKKSLNPESNGLMGYIFKGFESSEVSEDTKDEPFAMFNPLTGNQKQGALRKLAFYLAKKEDNHLSTNHIDIEGNNVFSYQNAHQLSLAVRKFTEDPEYRKLITSTSFSAGSIWNEIIEENEIFAEKLTLEYLDGFKQKFSNKGISRKSMSDVDQHILALGFYQGSQKNKFAGFSFAKFFAPTLSDSTQTPIITFITQTTGFNIDEGRITEIDGNTKSLILSLTHGEYNRIANFQDNIKEKLDEEGIFKDYSEGADKFYQFPFLNEEYLKSLVKLNEITQEELETLWINGKLVRDSSAFAEGGLVNKLVTQETIKEINGLISTVSLSLYVDGIPYMDSQYLASLSQKNVKDKVAYAIADYVVNYMVFYSEFAKLFGGDYALAFKTDVNTTIENYQKRLGSNISPIMQGNFGIGAVFTKATVSDRIIKSKESQLYFKELGGDFYSNIKSSDAQEVVTLKEEVTVRLKLGLLDEETADSILSKIRAGKDYILSKAELRALRAIPTKPLYNSLIVESDYDFNNKVLTKSSSFPLIPQLIKGLALDKLRIAMETQGVDRVAHKSADKMGVKKEVAIYNEQGEIIDDIVFENSQVLSRDGFGVQFTIPIKDYKVTRGTQLNSMLFVDLLNSEGFEFKGKTLTGRELQQVKEQINIEISRISIDKLKTRLNVVEDLGSLDFKELTVLRDVLIEEAKERNWTISDIDKLSLVENESEFVQPLSFLTNDRQVQSLLLSLVNNAIVKQKMFGYGFVQASSSGWMAENDITSVVFAEGYNPKEGLRSYHKVNGELKPAQIILPWFFEDKYGNALDINKYILADGTIDTKKISPEVLNLIGFRIPTQGPSSTLPFEIVGFIKPGLGGLAVVPDEIVEQMGSDFDVDVLYTYLTQYIVDNNGNINKLESRVAGEKIPVDRDVEDLLNAIFGTVTEKEKTSVAKKEIFTYARKSNNGYEVSSRGDKRFSALNATLTDGRTIEEAYQIGVKGYNSVKEGKGKPPKDLSLDLYIEYKKLWDQWAKENPNLIEELRVAAVGKTLTDQFANTPVSQARALADILNETSQGIEEELINNEYRDPTVDELKQGYLDVLWSAFMHEDSIKRHMSPLESDDLQIEKEKVIKAKGLLDSVKSPLFISRQIEDNVKQISGKNLVAFYSALAKFHSVIQDFNLRLNEKNRNLKPVVIKNSKGENINLTTLSGYGTSSYENQVRTKLNNIVALQNAAVNNANENILGFLNLNDITAPISGVLALLQSVSGETAGIDFISMFMSQEILIDYVNTVRSIQGITEEDKRKAKDRAVLIVQEKWLNKIGDKKLGRTVLSTKKLEGALSFKDKSDPKYIGFQLSVLEFYSNLMYVANSLTSVRDAIMFAESKGAGGDLVTTTHKVKAINDLVINKVILNANEVLDGTEIGNTTENTIFFANNLYGKLFPYGSSQFRAILSDVQSYKEDPISIDDIHKIWKALKSYIYAKENMGLGDFTQERKRLLYGKQSLSSRVQQAKKTKWGAANFLIKSLLPSASRKTSDPSLVNFIASKAPTIDLDLEILKSFSYMLSANSDNNVQEQLARDLIVYSYMIGGIQGAKSFVKTIPIQYLEYTGFNESLRKFDISNPKEFNTFDFVKEFYQNNPEYTATLDKKEVTNKKTLPKTFKLNSTDSSLVYVDRQGEVQAPQYINIELSNRKRSLYIKEATDIDTLEVVYKRIPTLGTNEVAEYGVKNGDSVVSTNNITDIVTVNSLRNPTNNTNNDLSISRENYIQTRSFYRRYNNHRLEGKELFKFAVSRIQNEDLKIVGDLLTNALDYFPSNYKLEFVNDLSPKVAGSFSVKQSKVEINSKLSSERSIEEAIVHENIHALVSELVENYISKDPAKNAKVPDNVKPILKSITKLFDYVRNEFEKDPKFNSFIKKVDLLRKTSGKDESNSITFSKEEVDFYPLYSVNEFITGSLTNPDFQRILNKIRYSPEKSVFLRFTELITNLLSSIGKAIGVKVNPKSALAKAVHDSIYLINNLSYSYTEKGVPSTPSDSVPTIPDKIAIKDSSTDPIDSSTDRIGNPIDESKIYDDFKYFGAMYTIQAKLNEDGSKTAIRVINYKGKADRERKILNSYNANPDVDPQNGKAFRSDPVQEIADEEATPDYTPESNTITGRGITYTKDQQVALKKLNSFLNGKDEIFTLVGRAGTGKTTILKRAVEEYVAVNRSKNVIGATIAHSAKKILANSVENSVTVASLLGIRRNDNTGVFSIDPYAQAKIEGNQIIIIDEVSMVDDALVDEILKQKGYGAKVIFVGDDAQLPPINNGNKRSKAFDLAKEENYAKLTTRVRQGEESPIVVLSDILVKNIESDTQAVRAIPDSKRKDNVDLNSDTSLLFENNSRDALDSFISDFTKSKDIYSTRMITYNNHKHANRQSVLNLNKVIRTKLWGDRASESYVEGELLITYDTWSNSKNQILLNNSETFIVKSISNIRKQNVSVYNKGKEHNFEYQVADVYLIGDNGVSSAYTLPYGDSFLQYIKDIDDLKSGYNKRAGYLLAEKFPYFYYGYAVTTHKAQGATYENVYVMEDNILNANGSNKLKNQSLYVAVTRASKKLVLFSKHNPNQDTSSDSDLSVFSKDLNETIPEFLRDIDKDKVQAFKSLRKEGLITTKCN